MRPKHRGTQGEAEKSGMDIRQVAPSVAGPPRTPTGQRKHGGIRNEVNGLKQPTLRRAELRREADPHLVHGPPQSQPLVREDEGHALAPQPVRLLDPVRVGDGVEFALLRGRKVGPFGNLGVIDPAIRKVIESQAMIGGPQRKAGVRVEDGLACDAPRPNDPRPHDQRSSQCHPQGAPDAKRYRSPSQGEQQEKRQVRFGEDAETQGGPGSEGEHGGLGGRRRPGACPTQKQIHGARHYERQRPGFLQHWVVPDIVRINSRIGRRQQANGGSEQALPDQVRKPHRSSAQQRTNQRDRRPGVPRQDAGSKDSRVYGRKVGAQGSVVTKAIADSMDHVLGHIEIIGVDPEVGRRQEGARGAQHKRQGAQARHDAAGIHRPLPRRAYFHNKRPARSG